MRICRLSILFLLFIAPVHAQKVNEDSLKNVIAGSNVDSARVNAMLVYANYLVRHKMDDSGGLLLLEQAKQIAEKNNFHKDITRYYLMRGNYHQQKSDWAGAMENFHTMIDAAARIPDKNDRLDAIMKANNNLAGIYVYNGDYAGSLEFYLKALEQVERLPHNANSKATLYVNIASAYRELKLADKGFGYLQKITPLLPETKDALKIAYFYELYQHQLLKGQSSEAASSLSIIRKALTTFDLNEGQQLDLMIQYHEQAGQYEMNVTRNYAAALKHFEDFLASAKRSGDEFSVTEARYHIGWAYDSLRQYDNAIAILEQVYADAGRLEMSEFTLGAAELLAQIFTRIDDSRKGLYYATKVMQLKDSINSAQKLQQVNFLEAKYQAKKKEKEIADLKATNAEKELVVVKRNRLLVIGGLSALALLAVTGLLYRNSRQKQTIAENEKRVQQQQILFLEKQQQVVSMQSMVNGQEAERTRIAKDLHDGLGGLFSTIKMQLSTLKHDEKELAGNELFNKSYELVDSASVEIRRIAHNMMPEVLMKLGLIDAVRDMCNNISAGRMLKISMQAYGMEQRLNSSTEIMLYRIVQELLNNIIKHAQATEAIIQFNRDEKRLHITVEDNGKGFNTQQTDDKIHAGLETVQSRVNYLNGSLSIDSKAGLGTTIMMDFLVNE